MAVLKIHLLRAVYDWAVENGFTPYLVVDTRLPGVRVPAGYADASGRIVLNVHPRALQNFNVDDDGVRFSARFGGVAQFVEAPLNTVLAVYAKENGQGISFPESNDEASASAGSSEPPDPGGGAPRSKRPGLRVVK